MKRIRKQPRQGVVLIVVLVFVLLMGLAAYSYLLSMQIENLASKASADQAISQQAASSGIELLAAVLELPRKRRQELGGIYDNAALFANVKIFDELEDDILEVPWFMVTVPRRKGSSDEPWVFGATDESAKIHLGKLIEWDQIRPGAAQEILLRLPGMTDDVADAILDWIDADSEPRPAGAEVNTYAEFSVPISPRNGLPPNLEELLLVQGVEEVLLFGESRIVVQKVDDTPANRLDEFRPWVDYLTVYSGCRNESQDGLPRVFINQSNLFSLHQQLTRRIPIAWANFIILLRQYGPGDAGESSLGPELLTLDFTQPAEFTIDNLLDVIDSAVSVTRNDKAVRVPSPFSSDLLLMQHQLPKLFDQVTSDLNPFSVGQVNINMAPEEVLLAVPGIDEDLADKILTAQVNASDSESRRDHPVWLLTEGLVNIPTMKNLLPHLNTGGDVFRAEFWGRSDDRHGTYRCEAVVDATGLSARQTYLRELEVGKWPFLENQAQEKE